MKYLLILVCTVLLMTPITVLAKNPDKGKGQGPSPNSSAYEHAADNAKFKRGDDWQGGDGKADDGEYEDHGEEGEGKKYREQDRDHEKKQKGKKGDEESDDQTADDGGKKKLKQSGMDKGKK